MVLHQDHALYNRSGRSCSRNSRNLFFQIGSPVHRFSSFGDSIHQPDRLTDVFHFKWIQRSRVGEICWCVLVSTQRIDTGHLLFLPIIMEVEKMAIYLKGNYCWRLGVLSSMIHGRIRVTWATNCTQLMAGDQSVPKSGQKGGVPGKAS